MTQKLDYASHHHADAHQYSKRYCVLIWSLRLFNISLVFIYGIVLCTTVFYTAAYFPIRTCCGVMGLAMIRFGLQRLRFGRPNQVLWLNLGTFFLWNWFWIWIPGIAYSMQFRWGLIWQWYRDHFDPYLNLSASYSSSNGNIIDFQMVLVMTLVFVSFLVLCLNISELIRRRR